MKCIILAAGMGIRLRPLTYKIPKCLLEINGSTILENTLDNLNTLKVEKTIIVVGHAKEAIIDKIGNNYKSMPVEYIFAKDYETTNNIVSLWQAREEFDDDLFLIESDIMFGPDLLKNIIPEFYSHSTAVIGNYRPGMEGTALKVDELWNVKEILLKGNHGIQQYKTANIYYLTKDFLKAFKPFLQAYIDAEHTQEYYEAVFADILKRPNMPAFHAHHSNEWAEVDDIEDLKKAQYQFSDKKYEIVSNLHGHWPERVTDYCHLYNMYFPPEKMIEHFQINIKKLIGTYPSGHKEIAYYLSEWTGVNPDYLAIGNGASELIKIIGRQSNGICVSTPSFNEYEECSSYTARVMLNQDTWQFDKTKFLNHLSCFTGVIVTPNNPTSVAVDLEDIIYVLENTENRIVVDESFIDFSDKSSTLELLEKYPHLVVLKSMGKAFGICGLRLGFVACSDLDYINNVKKQLPIWNINNFAETFLRQINKYEKHFKISCEHTINDRDKLYKMLSENKNLQTWKPDGNFILCKILSSKDATQVTQELFKYHLLVKSCAGKTMNEGNKYIRIGCRTAIENNIMCKALEEILC